MYRVQLRCCSSILSLCVGLVYKRMSEKEVAVNTKGGEQKGSPIGHRSRTRLLYLWGKFSLESMPETEASQRVRMILFY